jgi:hypothetical protein
MARDEDSRGASPGEDALDLHRKVLPAAEGVAGRPGDAGGATGAGDSPKLEALLHESEVIHQSMQRIYNAMYTAFGVVVPAVISIFVFIAKEQQVDASRVAVAFIAVFALGSLWVQNLWMELFAFVKYRYLCLQPRIYEASGQTSAQSFLEFTGVRSRLSWTPIVLFNVLAGLFMISVLLEFVPRWHWEFWLCSLFIVASLVATVLVIVAARELEGEITAHRRCSSAREAGPRAAASGGELEQRGGALARLVRCWRSMH